jgi:PAS domain S-box-containing protein
MRMSDETLNRLNQIVTEERGENELWLSICPSAWEESHDAQIMFDKHGHVFRANRKARLILGYNQTQLRGKSVNELIPERFRTAHQVYHQRYVTDPVPRLMGGNSCLWMLTADGDEIPVEISLSPLESDRGLFINIAIRKRRDEPGQI